MTERAYENKKEEYQTVLPKIQFNTTNYKQRQNLMRNMKKYAWNILKTHLTKKKTTKYLTEMKMNLRYKN